MKFSHTSVAVRDMEESLRFYTQALGLEFERRREIPENNAEIAFVRDPATGMRIELTWWKDERELKEGDQLDHFGFEVPDLTKALEQIQRHGGKVMREPFALKGGSSRLAFASDPNGIWIELIEAREASGAR